MRVPPPVLSSPYRQRCHHPCLNPISVPQEDLTLTQTQTDSIIFLTLAMVLIAAALYLPEHIATVSHRAFYYYSGLPPHDVAGKAVAAAVDAVGEGVVGGASVVPAAATATVAGAAAAQAEEGARVAAGVVGGL